MAIEAFCPNGHKILCPEDRAGRTARCPKCSAPFQIPEPKGNGPLLPGNPAGGPGNASAAPRTANAGHEPTAEASPVAGSTGATSGVAQSAAAASDDYDFAATAAVLATGSSPSHAGMPPGDPAGGFSGEAAGPATSPASEAVKGQARRPSHQELIIFLCPNGHKLNGPRRLAGKVGQCPHCGVKFEIPFPEEDEADHDGLDDTVTEDPLRDYNEEATGGSSAAEHFGEREVEDSDAPLELEGLFEAVRANPDSGIIGRVAGRSSKPKKPDTPSQPAAPAQSAAQRPPASSHDQQHPLAQLVARLWGEREHGGVIELHLNGGAMLVPEWFDEHFSQNTHGLFASQAADGTVTMTVVPWDEVTRVVVRGVVGLPDGMFE